MPPVNLIKRIRSDVMAVHSVDDERISFADAEAIGSASRRVKLVACQGLGHAKLLAVRSLGIAAVSLTVLLQFAYKLLLLLRRQNASEIRDLGETRVIAILGASG